MRNYRKLRIAKKKLILFAKLFWKLRGSKFDLQAQIGYVSKIIDLYKIPAVDSATKIGKLFLTMNQLLLVTRQKLMFMSLIFFLSFQPQLNTKRYYIENPDYEFFSEACSLMEEQDFFTHCEAHELIIGDDYVYEQSPYREFCLLHGDPEFLMEFKEIDDNNIVVCEFVQIGGTRLRKSRGFYSLRGEENEESNGDKSTVDE